ncbi:twin-arginine translocase TatA/TatE family subunit [Lentzea sp. NPDC051213]|uniref:twin-arginine translocase TatA/TatE family subunit n=1 Tax=Lentzea sp. NPDC051213 TaxID=3364126 RepID=UPI0037A69674
MSDWLIPALVILVLLLFGSRRLPEMARSFGQSLKIFRSETKGASAPEIPAPQQVQPPSPDGAATPKPEPGQLR